MVGTADRSFLQLFRTWRTSPPSSEAERAIARRTLLRLYLCAAELGQPASLASSMRTGMAEGLSTLGGTWRFDDVPSFPWLLCWQARPDVEEGPAFCARGQGKWGVKYIG